MKNRQILEIKIALKYGVLIINKNNWETFWDKVKGELQLITNLITAILKFRLIRVYIRIQYIVIPKTPRLIVSSSEGIFGDKNKMNNTYSQKWSFSKIKNKENIEN